MNPKRCSISSWAGERDSETIVGKVIFASRAVRSSQLNRGFGEQKSSHRWKGASSDHAPPSIAMDGDALAFDVTSEANPNNVTPATQGVMLRVRHDPRARICAVLSGQRVGIPLERLLKEPKAAISG